MTSEWRKSYETALRGKKGVEILMRDASGRIKGKYENGIHDIPPESGHNLKLSIDIELQEYGEQLMRNKIGAIVAIEPSTGEILALVKHLPTTTRRCSRRRRPRKNYVSLAVNDIYKPLYDRSIQGTYPPGSTFKPTQGLIFPSGRGGEQPHDVPLLPRLCEPSPGRLPRTDTHRPSR